MYYAEEVENGDYGIFNTDNVGKFKSGHCFATYASEQEALEKAKELNNK